MTITKETESYTLSEGQNGSCWVRSKRKGCHPTGRKIGLKTAKSLRAMSDSEFDGTCVLELGVGAFQNT